MRYRPKSPWFTPVTAALGKPMRGVDLCVPDHLAAVGAQYSSTRIQHFEMTYIASDHFKVARLCHLGKLLGTGSRYVLSVEINDRDIVDTHEPGHSDGVSRFTSHSAECVQRMRVHEVFDLCSVDDLRSLTSADWNRSGTAIGSGGPHVLGPTALALEAFEAYWQLCSEFPSVFDRRRMLAAIARAGDPQLLADWLARIPVDIAMLASLLAGRPYYRPVAVMAPVLAESQLESLSPAVAREVLRAIRALPLGAPEDRCGKVILETLAALYQWHDIPAYFPRFASHAQLVAFLAAHFHTLEVSTALAVLDGCFKTHLPDEVWRMILGRGDDAIAAAALARHPPDSDQRLRIVADAMHLRAETLLGLLDPDRAVRTKLIDRWRTDAAKEIIEAKRMDHGEGVRAYVKAIEYGDLERMKALEAQGVDARAYFEVGLRLARKRGDRDVEMHILGLLVSQNERRGAGES